MTNNEAMMTRIRALLAKAESTTPEEAELLTAKAEELMLRHTINREDLDKLPSEIHSIRFEFTGSTAVARRRAVATMAQGLGARGVYMAGLPRRVEVIYVWTFENELEATEAILRSLVIQMETARLIHLKDHTEAEGFTRLQRSRQFIEGFGVGARNRMMSARSQTIEETGTGTLVTRRSLHLKDRVNDHYNGIRQGRDSRQPVSGSFLSGMIEGSRADTGEKSLTN